MAAGGLGDKRLRAPAKARHYPRAVFEDAPGSRDEAARLTDALDDAEACLTYARIEEGMALLAQLTNQLREESDAQRWRSIVDACQSHPVFECLLEDPFTSHAYMKPRGYAGDACLLDLIYGTGNSKERLDNASALGRKIYDYAVRRPAPEAVRWRCRHATARIDEMAQRAGPVRVLAVGSGHAREIDQCRAFTDGGVTEFVALDGDPQSLAVLAGAYSHVPITCIGTTVSTLPRLSRQLGLFDLVYSLGLFDYLPAKAATRTMAAIAGLLRPGGKALVANFTPCLPDTGYMEAFMDWRLIYRDEDELRERCAVDGRAHKTYRDPAACVAFLELTRT